MKNNLLPVAKEGWNYLIFSVAALLLFILLDLDFLQFIAFLTTLFFLFVFRNPERQNMLYQENSVVSPVDGKVVSIEELDSKENYAYKIEVESSYLNVSLLRAPFTSLLKDISIYRGARLSSIYPLSKDINENVELIFVDKKSSNKIKVTHRLKQSFKAIDIDIIKAQNILQGSRYGFMLNGVTTLYLPSNFRLNISVGNELAASESLIGYFTTESKIENTNSEI
jgi:phosphatidylserine decarboxylase